LSHGWSSGLGANVHASGARGERWRRDRAIICSTVKTLTAATAMATTAILPVAGLLAPAWLAAATADDFASSKSLMTCSAAAIPPTCLSPHGVNPSLGSGPVQRPPP
jgi:hypothetical protein